MRLEKKFGRALLHGDTGGRAARCRGGCGGVCRLLQLGLREGAGGQHLLLGLDNGDVVGQRLLGAHLAVRVPGKHDLDLDAKHALKGEGRN